MLVPPEAEHMEMLEVQLLFALSGVKKPTGGLDLAGEAGVAVNDAFPALHRLVRSGYVAHHKRRYTLTRAGARLVRKLPAMGATAVRGPSRAASRARA